MATGILNDLKKTAAKMGSCNPLWLKNEEEPKFDVVEGGTSGPEIILLHGLLGALSNWDRLFPLIESYSRPMAVPLPILTAHRSEVKVKALALSVEHFIRKRNIQPVTLCGNSLGGHIALRLCLASPELVDCLILSGTSGLYEHSVDTLPVRPTHNYIREHMGRVFYNQEFVTEEAIEEIYQILARRMKVLNLIHAARSAKKDNLEALLGQIKVPTLLLWGENDEITTMHVAETFHRLIPNSKLVTMKNCGHAPMMEYPEWFSSEIQQFLKQHSRYYKSA